MIRPGTRVLLAAAVFFLAAACAATGEYDPQLDRELIALRDKVDGFLSALEDTASTPDGTYAANEVFYDELWLAFDDLRTRAERQPANGPTVTALAALSENLHRLESLHRAGLTAAEVRVLRKILCAQLDALCEVASAKGEE